MGTLSSELAPHVERDADRPRVYADANVPAGLVAFMRLRLRWDVLFALEHADLRRARDGEHYALARQLCRTLVTLDRDFLDDRRFPPAESGGVIVVSAPNERALAKLLGRLDLGLFRVRTRGGRGQTRAPVGTLLLAGQKLHAAADWPGLDSCAPSSRPNQRARRRSSPPHRLRPDNDR